MKKLLLSVFSVIFFSLTIVGPASASWVRAGSDDKVEIFFNPEVADYVAENFEEVSNRTVR